MFERFDDRARRVVVMAQEEARKLNHDHIGTEHILLGLLVTREGVAATALESVGISLDHVREQVEVIIGRGRQTPVGHLAFTSGTKRVLELSFRESLQLGHDEVGAEHLLLGLIRYGEAVEEQVLATLGVDLNRIRKHVIQLLGERQAQTADPRQEDAPDPGGGRAARGSRDRRVFVGHTPELASWPADKPCVQAALDGVASADFIGLGMRHITSQDVPPAEVCEAAVRSCGVYVAIIGFQYGSLVPDRDVSYTELEFETATAAGIPRVMVLLRTPFRASPDALPLADADRSRIDRFRERVTGDSQLTVAFADDVDEVASRVYEALVALPLRPGWVMAGPGRDGGVRTHIEQSGQGSLSRGRAAALTKVTGWLQARQGPGQVLVVTGQSRTSRLGVIARAALEMEPSAIQRDEVLGLIFLAGAATIDDFYQAVARLSGSSRPGSLDEMVANLRHAQPPASGWWRVIVAGLDEAVTDDDRDDLARALAELAGLATMRVVVATRSPAPGAVGRFAPGQLLARLGVRSAGQASLVDLDLEPYFDRGVVSEDAEIPNRVPTPTPAGADHAGGRVTDRVFISHTSELALWPADLSCVQAALSAVASAELVGLDMRHFAAQDLPPAEVCEAAVRSCGVYVAVIGFRYGSLVPDRDVSYTELEFETATAAGIPRIVVMLGTPPPLADADRSRIDRFRDRLRHDPSVSIVVANDAGEVGSIIYRALMALPLPPGWLMAGTVRGEGLRGQVERAGRGQQSAARGGDLFRGRAAALARVTAWLQAPRPPGRVLVVTGQPGAGKSAVLGRAALDLEEPAVRAGRALGLFFHARGATIGDLLRAVARLTGTEVAGTVDDMISRVGQRSAPPAGWWRIVVDALDEASEASLHELARALVGLAGLGTARVVVASRPLTPDPAKRFAPGALLPLLGAHSSHDDGLVDLDTDEYFGQGDLAAFARAVLCQEGAAFPAPPGGAWAAYRANAALCSRLTALIASRAGRNFLVAALTADLLSRDRSVLDPSAAEFDPADLPSSVGEALDKYFRAMPERARAAGRALLTALAYGRGAGIDDDTWQSFAVAIGHPGVTASDLDSLRNGPAADFLLQSATVDGRRVTRVFHQALADELLAVRLRSRDEAGVLEQLLPIAPATWVDATPYAKVFAAEHAAAADRLPALLPDPVYPTVADLTRLLPLLPVDPPTDIAATVTVLRTAAHQAQDLPPARRAALFALAAAHLGLPALAYHFRRHGNLAIDWAHTRGAAHQTLTGHTAWVNAVAVGRVGDRDIIVSGSSDNTVRRWDATTGRPIGEPLTGHAASVYAVAIGRAGDRDIIVTGGSDATVRLWDATTGHPIGTLTGHTDTVNAVAIGRAGDRDIIVTGGSDATVRLWDATTGRPAGGPLTGHTNGVKAVAIGRAGDRDIVISGGDDETVRRWDAATGVPIGKPLTGHAGTVYAMAVGRVGDRDIIVTGSRLSLRVWDAVTGRPIGRPLAGYTSRSTAMLGVTLGRADHLDLFICAVTMGRVGGRDLIVTGDGNGNVRAWDPATGRAAGDPLTGHAEPVRAVAIGRAGNRDIIVTGGDDATVRIWDASATRDVGQAETIMDMAVGQAGDRLVIAAAPIGFNVGHYVYVWDAATGEPVGEPLNGPRGQVRAVAIGRARDRHVIAATAPDKRVRLWDAATGQPAGETPRFDYMDAVAMGRVGNRDIIVTGSYNSRTVQLWDATSGRPIGNPLTGHTGGVQAVAIGRAGDRDIIVSGGDDATVRRWDAATGHPIGNPLTGHTGGVQAVAIGRAGDRDIIVSCSGTNVAGNASEDGGVLVWDAATGARIGHALSGHTGQARTVAIGRADGRDIIVTGGADTAVRIWDAAAGAQLLIQDTLDPVRAVALADGRLFVAAGPAIWAATVTAV